MDVNGKKGFEFSNFELSKVFQEPNPYLTQGIPKGFGWAVGYGVGANLRHWHTPRRANALGHPTKSIGSSRAAIAPPLRNSVTGLSQLQYLYSYVQ